MNGKAKVIMWAVGIVVGIGMVAIGYTMSALNDHCAKPGHPVMIERLDHIQKAQDRMELQLDRIESKLDGP